MIHAENPRSADKMIRGGPYALTLHRTQSTARPFARHTERSPPPAACLSSTQPRQQARSLRATRNDAPDPRVRDSRTVDREGHRSTYCQRHHAEGSCGEAVPLSIRNFANGWSSTLRTPYTSVDENRMVQFESILEAGTKTDGTSIVSFPTNLRPARVRTFWSTSVRSSDGRQTRIKLELVINGNLRVYGMPSDDNYAFLYDVRFHAA